MLKDKTACQTGKEDELCKHGLDLAYLVMNNVHRYVNVRSDVSSKTVMLGHFAERSTPPSSEWITNSRLLRC